MMSTRSLKDQWVSRSNFHSQDDNSDLVTRSLSEGASGLKVRDTRDSRLKLVFSDQEICDDVVATMPKLDAAVRGNAKGARWKHGNGKSGVNFAELKPYYSTVDLDDDLDILDAVAAKTELQCHLNEALSVLLHRDSDSYEATMKALCGKQFKSGQVLFHQRVVVDANSPDHERAPIENKLPNQGAISVMSTTMSPSSRLKVRLRSRRNRTQQLIFAAYTHQSPDKKRAVHLMKTVPKDVHDQVLQSIESSPLRHEIDHIGVGFDLQFIPQPGGSNRQCTQIFAHAYASDRPAYSFTNDATKTCVNVPVADLTRRRAASMNPEARNIMRMLTESLSQFERVIRRRRFGFQSFIYFPIEYADPLQEKYCSICNKNFHFFRRDFYCQLCGHMVCGDCSDLHEVEARIGEIRKNRCCRQCVVRVDACKFDDEDLVPALGPIIVETPSEAWLPSESSILSSASSDGESSVQSEDENLADQLCSDDPETRSRALEILGALVDSSSSLSSSSSASPQSATVDTKSKRKLKTSRKKTQVQDVLSSIEKHVNEELSKSRLQYTVDACDVSDRTRDYKYEFDASKVTNEDIPLAPMPEAQKDARRVEFIKNSGALQPDYDRSALNLIAQVAAKRLGCPIGVVSMIDDEQFHAVGNYNLSPEAHHLPRNEVPCMHSVYAEKPLVIKNPQRDMRFAKMPCVDDMGVKFYAGFPLRAANGEVVGNVCALDGVAHNNISTKDYCTMQTLAKLASDLLQTSTPATSTA